MKKLLNVVLLGALLFLVAIGVTRVLVKVQSLGLDYYHASSSDVSIKYSEKILAIRTVNTSSDLNARGQLHVGLAVTYYSGDVIKCSEVVDYHDDLLVLFNDEKVTYAQVIGIGIISQNGWLILTSLLTYNINLYFAFLFVVIIIYLSYLFFGFKKNNQLTTEYSSADLICFNYMKEKKISFDKAEFKPNSGNLSLDDIISYVKLKDDIAIINGVGKNPTSLKVNGKRAFGLIYINSKTKLTFKCGPLIGEEITKVSNGIVLRSNFPHGSVWFAIDDITSISNNALLKLLDIAYQLAAKEV